YWGRVVNPITWTRQECSCRGGWSSKCAQLAPIIIRPTLTEVDFPPEINSCRGTRVHFDTFTRTTQNLDLTVASVSLQGLALSWVQNDDGHRRAFKDRPASRKRTYICRSFTTEHARKPGGNVVRDVNTHECVRHKRRARNS